MRDTGVRREQSKRWRAAGKQTKQSKDRGEAGNRECKGTNKTENPKRETEQRARDVGGSRGQKSKRKKKGLPFQSMNCSRESSQHHES